MISKFYKITIDKSCFLHKGLKQYYWKKKIYIEKDNKNILIPLGLKEPELIISIINDLYFNHKGRFWVSYKMGFGFNISCSDSNSALYLKLKEWGV